MSDFREQIKEENVKHLGDRKCLLLMMGFGTSMDSN